MPNISPPPTYAEVVLYDEATKKGTFNPAWLKWFLDIYELINNAGGSSLEHNLLDGLQGGTTDEFFHLTSARYTTLTGSQNPNLVFSGPATGPAAAATFRALVAADLPAATGTVTSVAVTGNDGIVVGGSPITTTGTITLDLGNITPTSVTAPIDGILGGNTPAAATITDLTVTGATILGNAAGDSVTVNAETVSQPNIPCFLAINSANDTNQTGAGATVTVDFDSEIFDQSGDFAADTFTAPATGKYLFAIKVRLSAIPAGVTSCTLTLVTTARSYTYFEVFPAGTFTTKDMTLTTLADMTSGDTASVSVTASGGAGNTATIVGNATNGNTYFSGRRVA